MRGPTTEWTAILTLVVLAAIAGCVAPSPRPLPPIPDGITIPADIYLAAANATIARVGSDVFSHQMHLNRTYTGWQEPVCAYNASCGPYAISGHWWVVFDVDVGQGQSATAQLRVWPDATVGTGPDLPDCARHAERCHVRLGPEDARHIASEHGLGVGIVPWKIEFVHHADGGFRWTVTNTTYTAGDGWGYQAGGSVVSIDATSGQVLETMAWSEEA